MTLDQALRRSALLVLGILVLMLANGPSAASDAVAERMVREFDAVTWAVPYSTASAGAAACRRFAGDTYEHHADELWCDRCRRETEGVIAERGFYAFTLESPPVCRLGELHVSAPIPSFQAAYDTIDAIARRFGSRYGPDTRLGDGAWIRVRGSAAFSYVRRWRTGTMEIHLYVAPDPLRVELVARHRLLLDALDEDDKLFALDAGPNRPRDDVLRRMLVERLGGAFPDLASVLARNDFTSAEQEKPEQLLSGLLRQAARTSGDERAALFLAADLVAGRLHVPPRQVSVKGPERYFDVAGIRLTWEANQLAGSEDYTYALLWRVWTEHRTTRWADHAFALLLSYGWDTRVGCAAGSDQYRTIIREAERFLADRPASAVRLQVVFALAQAYETWWSLSQATSDVYVDAAAYQAGAIQARSNAIARYEEVLRLGPADALETRYARRRLARLKLGVDTNQRRFFCIYD